MMPNDNYYYTISINNIILNYKNNKINKINIIKKDEQFGIKEENLNNKNQNKNQNYIMSEIMIDNDNSKIRIINSFEEYKRKNGFCQHIKKEDVNKYENEKDIKNNCKIMINNKKIKFSYYNEFKKRENI